MAHVVSVCERRGSCWVGLGWGWLGWVGLGGDDLVVSADPFPRARALLYAGGLSRLPPPLGGFRLALVNRFSFYAPRPSEIYDLHVLPREDAVFCRVRLARSAR